MIVIAACLLALGTFLLLRPPVQGRLTSVLSVPEKQKAQRQASFSRGTTNVLAASGGALLGWTFGGVIAAAVGGGAGWWLIRSLRKREARAEDSRDLSIDRDAPMAIDLLIAALASGATPRDSLVVVRDAFSDQPIAELLTQVITATDLGAEPREAWSHVARHPQLGALGHAFARTHDSGAELEAVLLSVAGELRRSHRIRVEVAARSAGVKAVLPLAACFLPAFFALGVVPIIASFAQSTGITGG